MKHPFFCETPPTGAMAACARDICTAIPNLTTDRLVLRAPRVEDFPIYADIACGPRGEGVGGPMPRDEAWWDFTQLASGWLLHGHGGWTITLKDNDQAIGFVLIGCEPGDENRELGYLIDADFEGMGYAAEAALTVRDYGYDTLGIARLDSYIFPENTRSIALAKRLGATQVGELFYPGDSVASLVFRHPGPEDRL